MIELVRAYTKKCFIQNEKVLRYQKFMTYSLTHNRQNRIYFSNVFFYILFVVDQKAYGEIM
jgi:hypothetical protein